MTLIKHFGDKSKKRLRPLQESFFLFGYHPTDMREFPFDSQRQRRLLWEKFRDSLCDMIFWSPERFEAPIMVPDADVLRPREWWKVEGFGLKLVLNGAILIKSEVNFIWDKDPAQETDYACLVRLNLLNEKDQEKVTTEAFRKAEGDRIAYRSYIMETSVRVVQPLPIEKEIMEQGGMTVRKEGGRPEKNSSTDLTSYQETLEQAGISPETANTKEGGIPEKPAPVEPAGQCPRCGRRLSGLDSERSLCGGCGATFDRETLAKLWKSVDQAERERRAGHKVLGD